MKRTEFRIRVLRQGDQPPCVGGAFQCRGCFGWRGMIEAAYRNRSWRRGPLHCPCTGLTIRVVETSVKSKRPRHPRGV
ncbi:MAG: hypothetical protein JRJ16_03655 [Deltaproteobacteria bacterium]|nr:hypothetical protein [Deltaproteobacteria bacterium]